MDAAFYDAARSSLYGGALSTTQVEALEAIGAAWEQYGDGDQRKLAYILATAHHETGAFKWLKEIWGPTAQQKKYEGRADLGNTVAGDGKKFAGRGFVQLTGRRNYADWSKRTGLDLLKEPQLVEAYPVAARILVQGSMLGTFTGKKLGDYFKDPLIDPFNARRVINGTDKADLVARYWNAFNEALAAGGNHSATPQPIPADPERKPLAIGWLIVFALIAVAIAAAIFIRF